MEVLPYTPPAKNPNDQLLVTVNDRMHKCAEIRAEPFAPNQVFDAPSPYSNTGYKYTCKYEAMCEDTLDPPYYLLTEVVFTYPALCNGTIPTEKINIGWIDAGQWFEGDHDCVPQKVSRRYEDVYDVKNSCEGGCCAANVALAYVIETDSGVAGVTEKNFQSATGRRMISKTYSPIYPYARRQATTQLLIDVVLSNGCKTVQMTTTDSPTTFTPSAETIESLCAGNYEGPAYCTWVAPGEVKEGIEPASPPRSSTSN